MCHFTPHLSHSLQKKTNGIRHSLTDKASDFESEDWGFESVGGLTFEFIVKKVEYPKRVPKRKKWSHKTINTYKVKEGQSETTRGIECHNTLQRSIHCNHCCFVAANASLKRKQRWKNSTILTAQRSARPLSIPQIWVASPSVVLACAFMSRKFDDPKGASKRKKWSQETIITQRTKDGSKSERTEHIECHFTLQLIHWL